MKYAFFDVDGTLYNGYSSNDLTEYLFNDAIVSSEMYPEYKRLSEGFMSGSIPYNTAVPLFIEHFAHALKGLKEKDILEINENLVKNNNKLFPWVHDVIHLLKQSGYSVHLLSAGIETVVRAIADIIQADSVHGSVIEIMDGVYTGKVTHILNHTQKTHIVKELLGETKPISTIGFGDSVGDIEMLLLTDTAFIVNPRQDELKEAIQKYNWTILNTGEELKQVQEYIASSGNFLLPKEC